MTGSPADAPLLEVEGLVSGYGLQQVLHGVHLRVGAGEVVAIIGPNGSGKSTVLKAIMGFLRAWQGSVRLSGQELGRLAPHRRVEKGIAYVPQGRTVFPDMTVEEHLDLGAWTVRDPRARREARERVLSLFGRLAERLNQKAGTMSGGEQQMLSLARALMVWPRLLLLDEPTLGLAPMMVEAIFETIVAIHRSGVSVLMVEQNAAQALQYSHRAYVLEMGRNRFEGPSPALLRDPQVRYAYLGGKGPAPTAG
ncbi:MAG TPA: ABC transporter ATP-binding protein [Limnochordales bacterium]